MRGFRLMAALVLAGCVTGAPPETAQPEPVTTLVPTPTLTEPPQPTATPATATPAATPATPPTTSARPTTQPSRSPTADASPVPSPPAAVIPDPQGRWQYIEDFPERDGTSVAAVLATDSGFVALATSAHYSGAPWSDDWPAAGETRLVVFGSALTSADGVRWKTHEVPSMEGAWMTNVVSYDGRLYASGWFGACLPMLDCEPLPENIGTNFWRSDDGVEWELLPQPDDMKSSIFGLLVVGDELWAAGSVPEWGTWTSTDAITWERTGQPVPAPLVQALTPERLISWDSPADGGTEAWYSDNAGRSWSSTRIPSGPASAWVRGFAMHDGRLVAVGANSESDDVQRPWAWVSDDGLSWSGSALEQFAGNSFDRVVAVSTGYLAIEGEHSASYGDGSEAWFSIDGIAWELIDVPLDERPTGVRAVGSGPLGVVVFGGILVEVPGKGMLIGQTRTEGRLRAWFLPAETFD